MLLNACNNIPNLRFCLQFLQGFHVSEDSGMSLKLQRAQSINGKDISETGAILNHGSLSTCKLDLDSQYVCMSGCLQSHNSHCSYVLNELISYHITPRQITSTLYCPTQ